MGTSSGSVLHLDCEFMLSEGKDGGAGLFFIVFKVIEESLGWSRVWEKSVDVEEVSGSGVWLL